MTTIAAVQMASGPNIEANLLEAERLIARAAGAGARLIVLPENFALMGLREADKVAIRETEGHGPIQAFLAGQAARHGVWLVAGTIPLTADDERKVRASCLLFNDCGQHVARYDKLHLFDVHPMPGVSYYSGVREGKYQVTTDSIADSILGQAVGHFDFTKVIEAAYEDGTVARSHFGFVSHSGEGGPLPPRGFTVAYPDGTTVAGSFGQTYS